MRARQVDGLISATARLDREVLEEAASELPLVLVNRSLEDGSVPAVTVDDREGIRLGVEHLTGLGHRRIGHLAGPQNTSTGRHRLAGFIDATAAAGLTVDDVEIRVCAWFNEREGARACAELLDAAPGLTAVLAANDLLAIGCYDTLEERGLHCPDEVSVVGFNDMPLVDHLRPPLTCVRVPQREIGMVAADLLLKELGDEAAAPRSVLLEPTLIVRGSTAAPSADRGGS
jgi:LacI family transcriptional regulator